MHYYLIRRYAAMTDIIPVPFAEALELAKAPGASVFTEARYY